MPSINVYLDVVPKFTHVVTHVPFLSEIVSTTTTYDSNKEAREGEGERERI